MSLGPPGSLGGMTLFFDHSPRRGSINTSRQTLDVVDSKDTTTSIISLPFLLFFYDEYLLDSFIIRKSSFPFFSGNFLTLYHTVLG
jgi:hypothetical protein